MNNKSKILITCLSVLLITSIGYALFSETIKINGTATAKGDFDVHVTKCVEGLDPRFNKTDLIEGGYGKHSCNVVNSKSVTSTVEYLMPTASKAHYIEVLNNGSIPASIDLSSGGQGYTLNTKICADGSRKEYAQDGPNLVDAPENFDGVFTEEECVTNDEYSGWGALLHAFAVIAGGGYTVEFYDENFAQINGNFILQPGKKMYVLQYGIFSPDDKNSLNKYSFKVDTNFTLNFSQITN